MSKIDPELLEALIQRARDLTYSMSSRLKRLPDYADFRAAFEEELKEHEKCQESVT